MCCKQTKTDDSDSDSDYMLTCSFTDFILVGSQLESIFERCQCRCQHHRVLYTIPFSHYSVGEVVLPGIQSAYFFSSFRELPLVLVVLLKVNA